MPQPALFRHELTREFPIVCKRCGKSAAELECELVPSTCIGDDSNTAATGRDVTDRLGEALRRYRHGLVRPLWADLPEEEREGWRSTAAAFATTQLRDVGLKLEISS